MNNATKFSRFIQNNQLIAISYLTKADAEQVHPRVRCVGDDIEVYGRTSKLPKGWFPLGDFLEMLKRSEPGLALGATRKSTGKQTSISFSQLDRLIIDPDFLRQANS